MMMKNKQIRIYIPFLDMTINDYFTIEFIDNEIFRVHVGEAELKRKCKENNLNTSIEHDDAGAKLWLISNDCQCGCDGKCYCELECKHHDYIRILADDYWLTFDIDDFKIIQL